MKKFFGDPEISNIICTYLIQISSVFNGFECVAISNVHNYCERYQKENMVKNYSNTNLIFWFNNKLYIPIYRW